jgi:hypothetical protein
LCRRSLPSTARNAPSAFRPAFGLLHRYQDRIKIRAPDKKSFAIYDLITIRRYFFEEAAIGNLTLRIRHG